VARPRHFIVARPEGGLLRVYFIADDRMKPENGLRRLRGNGVKDD
jgi:hypothetical protein